MFNSYEDLAETSLLRKVQRLQDSLVSLSTGGAFDGENEAYKALRSELLGHHEVKGKLPDFVRRYRDLGQFWQFIKFKFPTYAERRQYLCDSFSPLLELLEANDRNPGIEPIGSALESFDLNSVHAVWKKALDRRIDDPEGAITAARTLLETTCKHILDDGKVEYGEDGNLPKLWRLCAELLNLAPEQHQEDIFRAVLGNCQSIVNNMAAIRNKIGDAHGKGRRSVKPQARHAELVVNLAGTMAAFLVETWEEKQR